MSGAVVGPLRVGAVAHGGHCVARHEGRVVFVRHSLPGELVDVRITDTGHERYWRGDAVTVHEASPDRTEPPCPVSGPGRCGGCDLQHVALPAQRRLKAEVVAEQLQRLAGLAVDVEVEPVPGDEEGLAWRTRMRYHADTDGVLGLRHHRSHDLEPVPVGGCPISDPRGRPDRTGWEPGQVVETAVDTAGSVSTLVDGERVSGPALLHQRVGDQELAVAADGFWQVHPGAAETLVEAVLEGLAPQRGERAFDLYCGVGLFAVALTRLGVRVWGVESSRSAVAHARRNLATAGDTASRVTAGRVAQVLRRLPERTDLVVLDPPRTGAGGEVVRAVLARRPRRVAYVACDPAALARDLRTALDAGWRLTSLRAFDLFPMTHHVECVALLEPGSGV
ncbi:class I SAM-dependent RNA methyltransferase [Desertihabitans brevis]|uniref:class I SAM-dependent RNA methyltransferase n=1 Tax=Desertihabitans brevis TaxID=2268447 RepID=UPI001F42A077|nr:class I SAM-dependent RNA methyltransferase [Desertihabitans brevis]